MLRPHQYQLILLYVKNYGPVTARLIQNEIQDTFDVTKAAATVMAAEFITKAYKRGDISLEPNTADIFAIQRSEPRVATLHEQPEPGNG